MPRITDLKPQSKRTDRYNLYLDGTYKLPVSANTVLTAGLHVGMEVSEQELDGVRKAAEVGNAHDKALNYINMRRRSVKEIRDYLRRKEFAPDSIDEVVGRLIKVDLLNDEEFARAWVRDRLLLKPRSKRSLSAELMQKGIARQTIEVVLGDMAEGSERTALKESIAKKMRQSKYAQAENNEKLIAALAREGFSYSDIKNCLQQTSDT